MSASYALSEFGAALGLPGISLPPQGVVNIQLASGKRLSLEESGDEILIYLTVDLPHLDSARVLQLLQACDMRRRPAHEPCVQVGQIGHGADAQVLLLIRWPSGSVQASQLLGSMEIFERCQRDWLGLVN